MSNSKPVFTFGKMLGCGHCTVFAEKPTAETSPWATLVRDPELQKAVSFRLIEWGAGKDPVSGKMVRHELPQNLKFINYGPYFYLHAPSDSSTTPLVGKEFKAGEGGYQRNPADMKKWIIDTLKANPALSQVSAAPSPQVTAVPQPASFPRAQPGQARVAPPQQMQPAASIGPTMPETMSARTQQQAYFPPQPQQVQAPAPQQSPKEVKAVATEPAPPRYIARNRRR